MGRNHKTALLVKGKKLVGDGKKKAKAKISGALFPHAWALYRKQKALKKKIRENEENCTDG